MVLAKCHGNKMYVDARDVGVGQSILRRGSYEEFETELFKQIVESGMTVVDVGANIGYYTLIASRLVGSKGKVYAFEPEPKNFQLLTKNVEINHCRNVTCLQKAVSNRTGKRKLFLDGINLGAHSFAADNLVPGNPTGQTGILNVDTVTLDQFFHGKRIDLMKIDAQGAEGLVLDGAKDVLARNRKLKLLLEFWPSGMRSVGTDPWKLLKELAHLDLKIKMIDRETGAIHDIEVAEIAQRFKNHRDGKWAYVDLIIGDERRFIYRFPAMSLPKRTLLSRARSKYRQHGAGGLIRAVSPFVRWWIKSRSRIMRNWVSIWLTVILARLSCRTFIFRGRVYRYFYHPYNVTWKNERCVEVPIVYEIVKQYESESILEVGNVLSHYFPVNHDIIDKYESFPGVINEDVVDYHPNKKYGLIVSISTMEHVGWDEMYVGWQGPREPAKMLRAVENLMALLSDEGLMIVTVPVGYHAELDRLLREGRIPFAEQYCLKRISKNEWKQTNWDDIRNLAFGYPFPNTNGLVVGILQKVGSCIE